MTILVLSDTHMPRKGKTLPEVIYEELEKCDCIIHAGDVNDDKLIYELNAFATTYVVAGNTDGFDILDKYGYQKIVDIGGKKIGVVHGNGPRTTIENVKRAFLKDKVDCVIYGHSHIPHLEYIGDVLYFNPGSPTDKRLNPFYSYGLIRIKDGVIYPEIKYFDKQGLNPR